MSIKQNIKFLITIIISVILWSLWPLIAKIVFSKFISSDFKTSSLGALGDLYGSFNPLLTIISLTFIYYTIRKEVFRVELEKEKIYADLIYALPNLSDIKFESLYDNDSLNRNKAEYNVENFNDKISDYVANLDRLVFYLDEGIITSKHKASVNNLIKCMYGKLEKIPNYRSKLFEKYTYAKKVIP